MTTDATSAETGGGQGTAMLSDALIGLDIDVRLVAPTTAPGRWIAEPSDIGEDGVSAVVVGVGADVSVGSAIHGWIARIDRHKRQIEVFTREFGRLPISDGQRAKYRLALRTAVDIASGAPPPPDAVSHLSEFKGMLNRCLRADQRDWVEVFDVLGRPPMGLMSRGVAITAALRKAISEGNQPSPDEADLQLVRDLAGPAMARLDNTRRRLPAARLAHAGAALNPSVPERLQFEVDAAKTRLARSLHRNVLDVLRSYLTSRGFVVEENQHVDAYARLRTGPAIFEAKSLTDANELEQLRHGLSQLYEYRWRYDRTASLWLALSRELSPVNAWALDYLQEDRGVGVLWLTAHGTLDGPWLERLTETMHAARTRTRDATIES